jgi:hypothetical protein
MRHRFFHAFEDSAPDLMLTPGGEPRFDTVAMDVVLFLDEQIKIVEDDTHRNFLRAAALAGAGVLVIVLGWLLFKHDPAAPGGQIELTKQLAVTGGGMFTAALSVGPFKQITPNRRRISVLRAARTLPPEQIAALVSDAVREALKDQK